ncbi:MAG TPA: FecR domain-containing protein [Geminicoccaceae bacterium]|nr:FecR domain-containing protein [Geminicoccus sp.]HMU52030.1 FecR domain-containing protein [Geminicoccaceae bacterium]
MVVLAAPGSSPAQDGEWDYLVRAGDTVWDVAQRFLREPGDWPELQNLNRVDDPRRLAPGTVLRIPLVWMRLSDVPIRVSAIVGSATVLRNGSPTPEKLSEGDLLRQGDAVETAADSHVELTLTDGSSVVLAAGSKVVLERVATYASTGVTSTRLDLVHGRMDADVKPTDDAATRFEVDTVPALSSVRGTGFRVAIEPEAVRTATEVERGRVEVAAAGTRRQVDAGLGVVTTRGAAPGRPRPLLQPPAAELMPDRLERVPLRLPMPLPPDAVGWRWSLLGGAEVPLFERTAHGADLVGPDLPDGHYRARLRAIGRDGLEGLDREWQLEVDARPEPPPTLRPQRQGRVREPRPSFAWARQDGLTYRLQVAADPGFLQPKVELRDLPGPEARSPVDLEPGTWYWRIAAHDGDDEGPFSDPEPFERRDPPSAAEAEPGIEEGDLVIRVRAGSPGQRYQFQLAESPTFDRPVADSVNDRPELRLVKALPGRYYLRTRVIDDDGYEGAFTPPQQIDVPPTTWWPAVVVPFVMLLLAL